MTTTEYEEWGNPHHEAQYRHIVTYCPYDNVKRQAYPRLFITTGLNDTRVHYWGPVKWAAKLRAMRTDDNPLLLRISMAAGLYGPSGRDAADRETAIRYAFILKTLGISED